MTQATDRQARSRRHVWVLATAFVAAVVTIGLVAAVSNDRPLALNPGFSWSSAAPAAASMDACLAGQTACTVVLVADGVRHTWVGRGAGAAAEAQRAYPVPTLTC